MPKVSISHKGTTCIYGILAPSGKIYIGQTWDLYHRYKSGVSKNQRLLYRSYKKYGEENHSLFPIVIFKGEFTQRELDYWERYYIEVYKAEGYQLLNIREGGGNNGKLADETKLHIGIKSKAYHERNPEWSQDNIRRLIEANKGSKRSIESKQAISKALKGKTRTKEHCENLSMAKTGKASPHKGKHFSPGAKERIRNAAKTRNQKKCPVNQLNLDGSFLRQWPSIAEAALGTRIHKATLASCVRGVKGCLTAGGFKWEYTNELDRTAYINRARKSNSNGKPVTQMSLTEDVIKEWGSMNEAANELGMHRGDIRLCCKGTRKTAGGFIWKYK